MYSQVDRESGEPVMGATGWATASAIMRQTLGATCDGTHTHQVIEGSNKFGTRSTQKATCTEDIAYAIVVAIDAEIEQRAAWTAFPAAIRKEIAEEKGPLH